MEECAFTTDCNSEYAHKLDPTMSNGEENGVQSQIGEAEKIGRQSAKVAWLNKVENDWLNKVENEWEKLMYKSALNWKQKTYPEEAQKRLVDASDTCWPLFDSHVGLFFWMMEHRCLNCYSGPCDNAMTRAFCPEILEKLYVFLAKK